MINEHFYYLLIDIACISFPLIFSFHPAIQFYKEWIPIFKALLITAVVFIIWDEWFTVLKVWSFNPRYLTGYYIGHLPLEEILFFFFIPYCLMFMYHCYSRYFTKINYDNKAFRVFNLLAVILLLSIGLINIHKWYTGFTFTITGIILGCISFTSAGKENNWKRFWIIYLFGLIPFFIVNGLLTSIPIVQYNNLENLSVRFFTIPVEDMVYNLLLFLSNVVLYHRFKKTI